MISKEEAKHLIRSAHFNIDDPNKEGEIAVDKIYDSFGTCGTCKYFDKTKSYTHKGEPQYPDRCSLHCMVIKEQTHFCKDYAKEDE